MSMMVSPYAFAAAGGGSDPTSTDWRIYFPRGNSYTADNSGQITVNEIEMLAATSGGSDMCNGGTPFASFDDGTNSPSKAFDNNVAGGSGGWRSPSDATGSYIGYTFASAVTVKRASVAMQSGAAILYVQYKDASNNWITYITNDTSAGFPNNLTSTVTATRPTNETTQAGYAKWRLLFNTGAASGNLRIWDMDWRRVASGIDRAVGCAASTDAGGTPRLAVNNSSGSGQQWDATSNGTGKYLEIDFSVNEDIKQVAITSSAGLGPQSTDVQYFDPNTSTWTTYWSFAATWPSTTTQTFTKP